MYVYQAEHSADLGPTSPDSKTNPLLELIHKKYPSTSKNANTTQNVRNSTEDIVVDTTRTALVPDPAEQEKLDTINKMTSETTGASNEVSLYIV